jgi:hypothetical protein
MAGAFLIALSLTGLGCQNKIPNMNDVPPVFSATAASPSDVAYGAYPTPTYSGYFQRSYGDDVADVYPTHWDAVHATIWSFVIGRDPQVPTAAEIESSVYANTGGH